MNESLLSSQRQDWQTPSALLARVEALAPIALDPFTAPSNPTRAQNYYTAEGSDGFLSPWGWMVPIGGQVFSNPEYGDMLLPFAHKVQRERSISPSTRMSILVPARTDTRWWNILADLSQAICLLSGRVRFLDATTGQSGDPAPFPSCLFFLGHPVSEVRRYFGDCGRILLT